METETAETTAKRRIGVVVLVCLLALLVTGSATAAGGRTVRDPKFDTPYLSRHGRLDVTKASAGRRIAKVTHSVTMRAKLKPVRRRERPAIIINTRGGRRSTYEYIVYGSTVFRVPRQGQPQRVAAATLAAKDRTWRYRFDLDDVAGLGAGYGWAAVTQKRSGKFADVAPDDGYARSR